MVTTFEQIKRWLPFVFLAVGIILALFGYVQKIRQRRKKASTVVSQFKKSLRVHDMDHWKELYAGTRAAASAPAGHFINLEGKPIALDTMWTAGNEEHTAIQRMAECFEKLCKEVLTETVDTKTMWFEVGQLLSEMHLWLSEIRGVQTEITFLEEQYPSIKQVFDKYGREFKKWPYHVYVPVE